MGKNEIEHLKHNIRIQSQLLSYILQFQNIAIFKWN